MSGLVREYIFISKPNSHIILLLSDNKIDDDNLLKTLQDVSTIHMATMEKAEPQQPTDNHDDEEANKGGICIETIRKRVNEIKQRM
jgi:hypothetical protein